MVTLTNQSSSAEVLDGLLKDQENPSSNQNAEYWFGSTTYRGQSFTTGTDTLNIKDYKLYMKYRSGTSNILYCDIYVSSNDKPTGNSLGQASITAISNTSFAWYKFTFSSAIILSASTKYVAVVSSPLSASNAYIMGGDTLESYNNGKTAGSTDSGTTWTVNDGDLIFETYTYIYGISNQPLNTTTLTNQT